MSEELKPAFTLIARRKDMISVFIAGPIRGKDTFVLKANTERAREVAWRLMKNGFAVYCPHLEPLEWSMEILAGRGPVILEHCFYWLAKCDAVLLLPGYKKSEGAMMEHSEAIRLGKQLYTDVDFAIKQLKAWDERIY